MKLKNIISGDFITRFEFWIFLTKTIPRFFMNIWRFRRMLSRHEWYDYHFTLEALQRSLEIMEEGMRNDGMEEVTTLNKKISNIQRTIFILNSLRDSNFIELAEDELGGILSSSIFFNKIDDTKCYEIVDKDSEEESKFRKRVYARAKEIEESFWVELFDNLKGQDFSKFDKSIDWSKQFNGSGMRGWWD